jgi:copper(I)-binding protein
MTRRPTGRVRTATLVATLLGTAALALSGCSAGAVTQTDTTVTSVYGSQAQVGEMLLRDVTMDPGPQVVVPAGATVTLRGTLVNQALASDQLVSVSTPYAAQIRAEGFTTIPGNSATRMVGSVPGPVGPPSPTQVNGTMRITLAGTSQVLHEGPTYPVTFTFARSGSVTVPVPMSSQGAVPAS